MKPFRFPGMPAGTGGTGTSPQFGSVFDAFEWLASRIDYERTRWMPYADRCLNLDRMRLLLALLGQPEKSFPAVHVAGTKGKGSTSAMVARILQAAGYRTGLFTSPHLERLQERIQINGQMPTDSQMLGLFNALWPAICQMDQHPGPPLAPPVSSQLPPQTIPYLPPQTSQQRSFDPSGCLAGTTGQLLSASSGCSSQPPSAPSGPIDQPLSASSGTPHPSEPPDPLSGQPSPQATPSTSPTYFEILTAMGMLHFAQQKVHIAVLEVGLGGRLDATNLCQPVVSVITSISFDHTQLLGNTLEAIAAEKAGIIKPGIPVVSGVTQPGPRQVIRQVCRRQQAPLIELQEQFWYSYQPPRNLPQSGQQGRIDFHYEGPGGPWRLEGVELNLLGRHQAANAALALATVALLRQAGWQISDQACCQALADLQWPARCQLLPGRPPVLLDTAHNVASVEALLQVLEESFVPGRRLLLFAASEDKDVPGMLARLLPQFDQVVLTNYLDNPRAMPVEQLARLAHQIGGRQYLTASSPAEAWQLAQSLAQPEDLICITGSFFLIGQILPTLRTAGLGLP